MSDGNRNKFNPSWELFIRILLPVYYYKLFQCEFWFSKLHSIPYFILKLMTRIEKSLREALSLVSKLFIPYIN